MVRPGRGAGDGPAAPADLDPPRHGEGIAFDLFHAKHVYEVPRALGIGGMILLRNQNGAEPH